MPGLSLMDTAFVWFESSDTPMHVTGLVLLKPPADQQGERSSFARRLYSKLLTKQHIAAPFNWRLQMKYSNLPQWQVCDHVCLSDHVRLETLAEPGDRAQLNALVSRNHARCLDRSRPLWELTVIDGLDDGQVALSLKVHHALADGMRASGIFINACSETPDEEFTAFWENAMVPERHCDEDETGMVEAWLDAVYKLSKQAFTLPGLFRIGSTLAMSALNLRSSALTTPFTAPKTAFNRKPGQGRSICVGRFPMASFRQVSRLTGASMNDVALAVCDIALQRYLHIQQMQPEKPLVALMPINLRAKGDLSSACNKMSIGLVEMGQPEDTPLARLAAIQHSSQGVKQEALDLSPKAYVNYSILVNAAALLGGKLNINGVVPPASNLIISNVPGPNAPRYYMGAQMTEVYPLSLLLPGQSLNITLYSYDGWVHFGLVGCNTSLPNFEQISDYLTDALAGLEQDVLNTAVDLVTDQLFLLQETE
ncbi:wax ester/triacylglycerol synthase family O-acyltransferase [Corallincola luteus]|uniref:diacylglycerol O-acyltransferase n=1 Tax=Corallincola luteus TaxID=1775177 RepID=A0ABY2AKN1_9GAMM|nr:wax ester/triacylglycerol synthase family O-acyltransferase [Corallincola luteus]TCI03367.1 wax ester/triacylglycerol synthase family O-acyltransferase [Corallincola luteus]